MAAKKVLVVLTSHDKIDAINRQTGWYLVCCSLTLISFLQHNENLNLQS